MKMLDGLKVVEMAGVLAGPSVGMFLAELGAQVVKIEPPQGDVTRSWKLPSEKADSVVSAYFSSANAGKSYRNINWKTADGQAETEALIAEADILLTNFRDFEKVADWISPKTLLERNDRLIYCQLDGYESQPGRVAYDVVLQAETGYMSMNGTPESGPIKLPLAFMDLNAAHQMKQAILLALYQREKQGKGSLIRCSLERSALANLANQSTNWLMAKHVSKPIGSLHPNIAPYGETFLCKDGRFLVLAIGNDTHFKGLCILLGLHNLAEDKRFSSNPDRVKHRLELAEAMRKTFLSKSSEEWSSALSAQRIPAGVIRAMDEVHSTALAREMLWEEDIDGEDTRRLSCLGFSLTSSDTTRW